METGPHIAQIAALVGDPARARMLSILLDGRALTASELALSAGTMPRTASAELAKLTDSGLLAVEQQGRHRYFRLASPLVASMLEGIVAVAEAGPSRDRPRWKGGEGLRTARSCYDHLAGRLAVSLTDALVGRDHVSLSIDGGEVTPSGALFFEAFGIDLGETARRKRAFCKPCLDWSERRPHLAGALGAALLSRGLALGWVERIGDSRALTITRAGTDGFLRVFDVRLPSG